MNIVLGVDGVNGPDDPSALVSLLRRLSFPNAAVDVVDVIEPIVYGDWGIDVVLTAQAFAVAEEDRRQNARKAVQQVAAHLRAGNPALPEEYDRAPVRTDCPQASSATEGIITAADNNKADLIAVEGPHHGPLGAFLTGSVARSLVINAQHHSLLLAKAPQSDAKGASKKSPTPKDESTVGPQDQFAEPISHGRLTDAPLRVVFATDHSPYAKRCLRKLAAMAPQGISHLTVLCAYPEADLAGIAKCLPELAVDLDAAVRQSLERRNDEALDFLAPLLTADGATWESRVVGAPVNDAIKQAMEETHSDLLILGARGHGFFDRLTLGSVSFHQAMTAPYSLLILRP